MNEVLALVRNVLMLETQLLELPLIVSGTPLHSGNAIKLTRYSQVKRKKALDKNEKMCGKALKTRLIFRGAHK